MVFVWATKWNAIELTYGLHIVIHGGLACDYILRLKTHLISVFSKLRPNFRRNEVDVVDVDIFYCLLSFISALPF